MRKPGNQERGAGIRHSEFVIRVSGLTDRSFITHLQYTGEYRSLGIYYFTFHIHDCFTREDWFIYIIVYRLR